MGTFDQEALKRMNRIFDAVFRERERQEKLKADGRFAFTCSDVELDDRSRYVVLGGEMAEVARAVLAFSQLHAPVGGNDKIGHLRNELVQVAAVAVAWIEGLDKQSEATEGLQL